MKFGGTSVATPAGWSAIAASVQRILHEGRRPIVVASALSGISNRLDAALHDAAEGDSPAAEYAAIVHQHEALADALGIELPSAVRDLLTELRELLDGVCALRDASPRVRARTMAMGELMSTHLGAAFLRDRGLPVAWADVRDALRATRRPGTPDAQHYLSARIEARFDALTAERLADAGTAVLTQGFLARDEDGDTVLLGRGGSDTSAAYLGVVVGAERVEIWTDVPGLFTTNPNAVPEARQLLDLHYDEVESMASLGAKVLHPRSISPLRRAGIPLHVLCTYAPEQRGTRIQGGEAAAGIKAVTTRKNLLLVRVRRPSSWQPVGFMADVAGVFAQLGLSLDLLSASPDEIAATIDRAAAPHIDVDALERALDEVGEDVVLREAASISLVGSSVRDTLDRLGLALREVNGHDVHLVAPGASGAHVSLVVGPESVEPLSETLHGALFPEALNAPWAGPRWHELGIAERKAEALARALPAADQQVPA